jgi:hypothetical protein
MISETTKVETAKGWSCMKQYQPAIYLGDPEQPQGTNAIIVLPGLKRSMIRYRDTKQHLREHRVSNLQIIPTFGRKKATKPASTVCQN